MPRRRSTPITTVPTSAASREGGDGGRPADDAPVIEGAASWLSRHVLLLAVQRNGEGSVADVSITVGGRRVALDQERMPHRSNGSAPAPEITLAYLPRGDRPAEARASRSVVVTVGGRGDVELPCVELQALVRKLLAPLDGAQRSTILGFLASASGRAPVRSRLHLERSLFRIREALRERLPAVPIAADRAAGLAIDQLLAIDDTAFVVRGWMRDREAEIVRLTAVSPLGGRTELRTKVFRHPRPDVEAFYDGALADLAANSGFVCYFEVDAPCHLPLGWIVEMDNAEGASGEVAAPAAITNPEAVRDALVGCLSDRRLRDEECMLRHLHPALQRLQNRFEAAVKVGSVVQYGAAPPSPDVSVIVPLHRRIDLVETQLAEFANDPQMGRADLIYVLDSPELEPALRELAPQLFAIYRLPFRIAFLTRSGGFAAANNAAARLARGRLLVLLNSDVLPRDPGWLEAMATFYDATPDIGALGPKLLYEDDSLQHAGLYFERAPGSSVWENAHYFKGLHRTLPAANVTRPVPAVTGACLMIDRSLFERFGGLSGAYVSGDYEDSDLALRLRGAGRRSWYLPAVELYHLEGQSYDPGRRALNAHYNTWLHTHLWGEEIERVSADPEFDVQRAGEIGAADA